MLIIGVTGGIACGKSTVAGMFRGLGAEVIDADKIAHQAMRPRTAVWKKIGELFGKDILNEDLSINREKLGKIVFSSTKERRRLEKIVHPVAIKAIKKKIKDCSNLKIQPLTIIVIDAPLLIEANLTSLVDVLVVVSAWRRTQMRRLKASGLKENEAAKRIDSQMSLRSKIKLADYVIRNNGSLAAVERQVEKVWKEIIGK